MTRWDAARAKSQHPARKYKPVGPVGEKRTWLGLNANGRQMTDDATCFNCGRHACGCYNARVVERGVAKPEPPLEPTRSTIKARIDTLERFRELGMLDTPGQREAIYRMLLDGDYSGFGVKP